MGEEQRNPSDAPPAKGSTRRLRRVPPPSEQEKLADLRRLLVGPEQARLAEIEERFSADALGKALPAAAVASQKQGEDLGWALRPAVMAAIRDAVKNDPHLFVDALVPVMGPAIRKATTHALRVLVQQLNETLAHGLSLRGLRWRWEAMRTGRPFAEIVVLRSLVYRVEQVFLVHRESGLVLHHLVAPGSPPQDPDQVAAMLSAIDAFVHDAFREEARLARFHVGELVGWVEHGPMAVLVAVVRGTAPDRYGDVMREVQERIHLQFRQDLSSFRGEVDLFVRTESLLQRCLQSEMVPASHPSRSGAYAAAAFGALLLAMAVFVGFRVHRDRAEEASFRRDAAALSEEPGLSLTEARREGRHYVFKGLRDPLARSPEAVLAGLHPARADTSLQFAPFYSLDPRLTARRAERALHPPEGVSLELANGGDTLVARGNAPRAWIASARAAASALPAVARFDESGLHDEDARRELQAAASSLTRIPILFPLDRADILEAERPSLEEAGDAIAKMLSVAPEAGQAMSLTLRGHTDARGAEARNQSLSAARAEAVREALAARGVPRDMIHTVGAGVASVADTDTCAHGRKGEACARRVDFEIELR